MIKLMHHNTGKDSHDAHKEKSSQQQDLSEITL